jgi:peptidyl-tRNA hydrolase ICT1
MNVRKTKGGQVIIVSDRTRSQAKNIEDCMEKLTDVIRSAVQVPKDPDVETIQKVKQL